MSLLEFVSLEFLGDTPTALATHRKPTSRNRAPQRTLLVYLINAPNRRLQCGIVPTTVATAASVEDRLVGVMHFSQISPLCEFPVFYGTNLTVQQSWLSSLTPVGVTTSFHSSGIRQ